MLFGIKWGLLTAKLSKPCTLHVGAAVVVCTHQCFPVWVGCPVSWATGHDCVNSGYYLLLPCTSSTSSFMSARKNCLLVLCFARKAPGQGLSWVQQWGVLLGVLAACRERSAACAGRWCSQMLHYIEKSNSSEYSQGVSCQLSIRVLSYRFLAAFLSL